MSKIFISYKRNVDPDGAVATEVFETLRKEHDVFIDTTIRVGEKWAERIYNEINQADYLIVLLSEHSVHSEMVIAEIETAHRNNKTNGRPVILPVRLNYTEPFVYPLKYYINPLQVAIWRKDLDTPGLIDELKNAITGGELSLDKPQQVEILQPEKEDVPTAFAIMGSPEGTMSHKSRFYIERNEDAIAIRALRNEGVTITIKGPRQIGKSSLLNHILAMANSGGMKSAFIDFQLIENSALNDPNIFYRQFCNLLCWEFGVENRVDDLWMMPMGYMQKVTNLVEKLILPALPNTGLLLALDEVDRIFASPFRSDFFGMLRSWHNRRALGDDWRRFNIALVTSTEPYLFIADLTQSPFNVGEVIELSDFSLEQVAELNARHGTPLIHTQLEKLFELLHGYPYLTRKSLYLVASKRITFGELLERSSEDDGPFGDHLRNHFFRMTGYKKLQAGLLEIIEHQKCSDENVFFKLRGAGLVRKDGHRIVLRNPLYARYFKERLHD